MRRRSSAALAAPAVLLAVFAGCGGGERLSAGDLRTQAGAICAKERKATAGVPIPASPRGIVRFLDEGTAAIGPRVEDLARLRPPEELDAVYRNAVALAARQQRQALAALRVTRRGGDPVLALQSLARSTAPLARQEDQAWRVLRIPQCVGR